MKYTKEGYYGGHCLCATCTGRPSNAYKRPRAPEEDVDEEEDDSVEVVDGKMVRKGGRAGRSAKRRK